MSGTTPNLHLTTPAVGDNIQSTITALAGDLVILDGLASGSTFTNPTLTGAITLADGSTLVIGTVTGTQIGTGTTQKIGFYGVAPTAQIAGNVDVLAGLVTLGLRAASANPPLNLGTGALTAGASTLGATTVTTLGTGGLVTLADGNNVAVGTTTGTRIGTATTQKLGLYNATPIAQQAASVDPKAALVALGVLASGGASFLPSANSVAGAGTTTSTTYTGTLTGSTAATLTLTTGTSVLVVWSAAVANSATATNAWTSVAVSGATTVAASDAWSTEALQAAGGTQRLSNLHLFTGLTAGSNTFTLNFKTNSATTLTVTNQEIVAWPL